MAINRYVSVLFLGIGLFSLATSASAQGNSGMGGMGGMGGDDPATTFSVAIQQGSLPDSAEGMVISNGACGTSEGGKDLDVLFLEGCVTVDASFITGPTGGPLTLRLFTLGVRVNRLDTLLFFTDAPIVFPIPNESVYVSDRLPVTMSRNGSITVEVNQLDLDLIKAHQPNKGDLVGPIAIGEIVYTPDP